MSRRVFPDGALVEDRDFSAAVEVTRRLLADPGVGTIFEAAFRAGDCVARVDILSRVGDAWRVVEVKSGTSANPRYLRDLAYTTMVEEAGHNDEATKELRALVPTASFQTPKPTRLIRRIATIATSSDDDIVLDFFAGSGTTGDAVLRLNEQDSGRRRFMLVQLPEPTGEQRHATIADLTKERLRCAAKRLLEENPMFAGDTGFRVFKLDSSNIRPWEPDREDLPRTLHDAVEHVKADRTEQDVLFELLLKLGLDLTVPIETKAIAGHEVHSIGAGTLLVCLSESISTDAVEGLALGVAEWHKAQAPAGESTVVFRDSAFDDDVAKTNLAAILQQHGLKKVRSL